MSDPKDVEEFASPMELSVPSPQSENTPKPRKKSVGFAPLPMTKSPIANSVIVAPISDMTPLNPYPKPTFTLLTLSKYLLILDKSNEFKEPYLISTII